MAKPKSFIELIEDKYGVGVISTYDTDNPKKVDVISTGSFSLDVATGIGGIPKGRFLELYGPYSSAKTSLMLSTSRQCLKKGGKVLYVDPENGLTYEYINNIIGEYFDDSKFILAQPKTAEDSLGIIEVGLDTEDFDLIVLDSVGALSPKKEMDDELTDANVALVARLLTKFLRRNSFNVSKKNAALVFINQVRDKVGSYMGGYETPGGQALKHFLSMRIQLSRGQMIKQGDTEVGMYSSFVIKKNKLSAPFRSGGFPFMFGKGIDYTRDLVEFSEMIGVLEKRGSYYAFEGETIAQGIVRTTDLLNQDKLLLDKIKEKVYNIAEVKNLERSEDE